MEAPRFLAVRVGDLVAVQQRGDWWAGEVIHAEGGARCKANSLFQIACIDTGVIRTVNANAVVDVIKSRNSGALETTHNPGHQAQGTRQGNQQSKGHGG
ncbi:MAG: DUF3104 domain-containing protein [Cyanobacteria bacterium M_surface_10_m1_298]|nr:DUF3104 domain-containing protein [Cyanobacteria bacterium M_surface_10_m1_298]